MHGNDIDDKLSKVDGSELVVAMIAWLDEEDSPCFSYISRDDKDQLLLNIKEEVI